MGKKFLTTLSALTLAAAMSASMFSLAACGNKDNENEKDPPRQELTDKELEGTVLADWTDGKAKPVFESDGWTNESVFNTQWKADNVKYENGTMKLTITDNPAGSEETNNEYFGGEGRTYQYFGYGDFEVCMKPAKKDGTASTFFTCTGNYDTNPNTGKPNPWDEIDIEFLGSDTTEVQFNYYVNGVGGHEYMYDLGFDASEEFHEYGFRWSEDYIVWFVDNEPVYKVEATADSPMPSAAGRILMNYWCGTEEAEGWMGEYSNPGSEGAEYKWVKTSAQAEWGEIPEEVEVEEFEGDWTTIDAIDPEYEASQNTGSALYTITEGENGAVNVTYASAGNYDNVNFDATEYAEGKNWFHVNLTNNGTTTTNARINVRSETTCINAYAFGNGEQIRTNLGEGSFVDIPAGETVEVEIYYTGVAASVEFMLDSLQANAITKAGDITISDVKFATQGEVVIPEEPEQNNNGIKINDTTVTIDGNLGGQTGYYINSSEDLNSVDITYTGVIGATYSNVDFQGIGDIAGDKDTLTFTVKNNGTENVTLRADVIGTKSVNENHKVCNTSATINGEAASTDMLWGGSTFTLAAGQEYEIVIKYNAAYDPANLQLLIDSSTYNDTATHSGDITVSNITFSGEYVPEEGGEEEEPETPVTPPTGEPVSLTFNSMAGYTVAQSGVASNSIDVTYNGLEWGYCNIGADISSAAANNNTFIVKIKNNGTASVEARFDIQATTKIPADAPEGTPATDACNVSATAIGGSGLRTDTSWGGTFITVAASEEVTLVITYDGASDKGAVKNLLIYLDSNGAGYATASGNVTISGFEFANVTAE